MIRATATESSKAGSGRRLSERAIAGGAIIRLNTRSDPTTGTAMLVVRASKARKPNSVPRTETPRTTASSAEKELSSKRRNNRIISNRVMVAATPSGTSWARLIPSKSTNYSEKTERE